MGILHATSSQLDGGLCGMPVGVTDPIQAHRAGPTGKQVRSSSTSRGPHVFGLQAFIAPLDTTNPRSRRCQTQPMIQPLTARRAMVPF